MHKSKTQLLLPLLLSLGAPSAFAQGVPDGPPVIDQEPPLINEPAPTPSELQPAVQETAPAATNAPAVSGAVGAASYEHEERASGPIVAEVVMEAAPPAQPSLVVTGSFFTRYELREGYAELGRAMGRFAESDYVRYRARLGLATTPIDIGKGRKVTLSFAPQASGFWADKGGTLADGVLGMHTAKVRVDGDSYWLDTGRFEMVYGEHLVIGSVDWHETARTFDGMRTRIWLEEENDGKPYVDAFLTQVTEDPTEVKPFGAGDVYFAGVYAGLGPMLQKALELDGYLLSHIIPRSSEDEELGLQFTVGSRVKKQMGKMDLRGEAGVQVGTGGLDQLAFQVDGEVGTKVMPDLRLAVGGWYASGDDAGTETNEAWNQLYPTAHKFLGFMDIIGGRSNVMGGIGRAKYSACDDFVVGGDAHLFMRPQTPDGVDAYTGFELDSWVLHKLGKGLGLRGGYSIFVPNENGPYGTSDLAHYLEIQFRYDLK